ncbi:MAG: hypothetical protein M1820_006133 [Bogoriella megaspora]|nr:MAG: hypothetical protein M1820_006133 [Bogoriella megaspora]
MTTSHLSNDEFLTHLTNLLSLPHRNHHGSIFISQKRLSPPSSTATSPPTDSTPSPLIFRASNGRTKKLKENPKERISLCTVVQPDDLEAFFTKYAEVCKAGMSGLKKRVRDKKKKKAGKGKK